MATKEEILDSISQMTVLELSELLKEFEERFDVTAAAPAAVAVAAPAAGPGLEGLRERAVLRLELFQAGVDHRQLFVAIDPRATVARDVLDNGNHAAGQKAITDRASEVGDDFRILTEGPVTDDLVGLLVAQIEQGQAVDVHSHLPVFGGYQRGV